MCDEQRRRAEIARGNLVAPFVINRKWKRKTPSSAPSSRPHVRQRDGDVILAPTHANDITVLGP